jgi:hypothetical protein
MQTHMLFRLMDVQYRISMRLFPGSFIWLNCAPTATDGDLVSNKTCQLGALCTIPLGAGTVHTQERRMLEVLCRAYKCPAPTAIQITRFVE